jgi:hypothetical protein
MVLETRTERTTVDQMRWNEPLSNDLFDTDVPSSWVVENRRLDVPAAGLPAEARFVSFAIHLLAGAPGGGAGNAASAAGSIDTARLLPKWYLSNDDVETASVVHDGSSCSVSIQMTAEGAEKLARLTRGHIGEQLALVIDGKLEMAPTIRSEITDGRVKVTGSFSEADCQKIAGGLTGARQ